MNPEIKVDIDDDGINDVKVEDINGQPVVEFSGSLKKYAGLSGLITVGFGILYMVGRSQGWF